MTARWPYFAIFTVGLGAWAAIFWQLRRRRGPVTFVERQLAHIWGAGVIGAEPDPGRRVAAWACRC